MSVGAHGLAARVALGLGALLVLAVVVERAAADEGTTSLFVRGDTDSTVVISPRVSARTIFNEDRTSVAGAYSADVWTSASIDVRTAATVPITELRDQLDLSVNHELDDVTFGGSYYYSGENDYWSHGFTLRSVQELAGGSTTFEESVRYVHDTVGRSGDSVERPLDSFTLRAVYTQIFNPETIAQLVWEGTYRTGYQSSPYRWVGLLGDGICGAPPQELIDDTPAGQPMPGMSTFCVPENHPTTRVRNAFLARVRYAFSRDTSMGLGYRFYFDDWGVTSHTATLQIGFVAAADHIITLRYRFYAQTAAAFYRPLYVGAEVNPRANFFVTRDRELSPMISNRVAVAYQTKAPLAEGVALAFSAAVGLSAFLYQDYVGLDEVFGLDGTVAFTLEL